MQPQHNVVPVTYRPPFAIGKTPWHDVRPHGQSILEIVRSVPDLPRSFLKHGTVCVNGKDVPRDLWSYVRPRPATEKFPIVVTLHWSLGSPGGGGGGGSSTKSVVAIVAAVALLAVTAALAGPFGAGLLAGTAFEFSILGVTSAQLLAGAVGLAGALAISMLTAPPTQAPSASIASQPENTDSKDPAGATGNLLGPGGSIRRVIGTRKIYPPFIGEPLVELVGEDEYVEAIFALNGTHSTTDIRVDGVSVTDMDDVEVQTRDGNLNDDPIDLVQRQGKTITPQITISEHKLGSDDQSLLSGGTTPTASDLPIWHRVVSRIDPHEIWLHIGFPSGLADANAGTNILAVPFRLRMRRLGDSTWINFPEFHYTNQTTRQLRREVRLIWQGWGGWNDPGTSRCFYRAHLNVPAQTASPAGSGWTGNSYFDDGSGNDYASNGNTGSTRIRNMNLYQHRVEFYLDDSTFPRDGDAYEIEIIKGSAYLPSRLTISTYKYSTLSANVIDLFWAYLRSGVVMTPEDQTGFVHQVVLTRVASVWNEHPVNEGQGKFAFIAIKARNRSIQRLSTLASGLCDIWNDGDQAWSDYGATSNPAAHYHDVLLNNRLNLDPLEEDLVDNDTIVDWFGRCDNAGWTCDAIIDDMRTQDVLSLLASCGYARPYQSDQYGVTIDDDKSEESPVQVFSRRNTSGMKFEKAFAKVPEGFLVTFHDNATDNDNQQIVVYQRDRSIAIPGLLESITYDGLVYADRVAARALFDLDQANLRSTFYSFETDIESLVCRRGSLVALQHDILTTRMGDAYVKEVSAVDGAYIDFVLDAKIPIVNEGDLHDVSDMHDVEDMHVLGLRTGIAIRHTDGTITTHLIDGSFSTGEYDEISLDEGPPEDGTVVAYDDTNREYGSMIVCGDIDSEYKRMLVQSITPTKDLKASVVLVDEAPELDRLPE